ncbi:MAG: ATP synthase subunit I [Pyrinomonadaceae bacterium]|nr:ATP synthase subunit I [Pyrinomonadaceae bacterium]
MKETGTKQSGSALSVAADNGIDGRIFRTMAGAAALAVIISALFAPWRITTGLLVGGVLSLLNHYWMRNSISAGFALALGQGTKPRIKLVQYVLRYFVVGAIVFAAYQLNIVSLPATVAGLCSFVVALFVEAVREFYFAIIHREGIN